jgi:hypothetical protein
MEVLHSPVHWGGEGRPLLLIAFEILDCDVTELFRFNILNIVLIIPAEFIVTFLVLRKISLEIQFSK